MPQSDSSTPTIGFIGLGNMGHPMVANLVAAGHRVHVHDIDPKVGRAVADATGAIVADTGRALAAECTVLITMLPNAAIVRSAIEAAGPLRSGTLIVDMSSSYPLATRQLGAELAEAGVILMDAPVSGGVRKARTGELCIMLGGDDVAAMDRVTPLMQPLGTVLRTGGLGSGHAVKALNNYVSAAGLAAASEALLVSESFGVAPETLIDVLNQSTGRNVATEVKAKPYIISRDFRKAQFAMDLMAKDVAAAAELAAELKLSLPGLTQAQRLWKDASQSLGPDADHTEIYRFLAGDTADPPAG